MVDTIDPVSTRHGTSTPPISTLICGQAATKFSGVALAESEPEEPPPELWLKSSGGESFPDLESTAYE